MDQMQRFELIYLGYVWTKIAIVGYSVINSDFCIVPVNYFVWRDYSYSRYSGGALGFVLTVAVDNFRSFLIPFVEKVF